LPQEEGVRPVQVIRCEGGLRRETPDRVAHEEPLEIQLGATALAVLMRTPGNDLELATGFLLSERVVKRPEELASLRHRSQTPRPEALDNVVRATLAEGVQVDLEAHRRNFLSSSSCGVCGKASLEHALAAAPPLEKDPSRFAWGMLVGLPERLRRAQRVFDETGGLHAAGVFDPAGRLLVVREDVGRHNAVDKVIGWAARAGRFPQAGHGLVVSGRVSFEIVQKALAARIPLVAAVSAPTSLAISLAEASGITLAGFVREGRMNVYACPERLSA